MRFAVRFGIALAGTCFGLTVSGQDPAPTPMRTLEGHEGGVTAIAFNSKGNLIVTGAGNGLVRTWDPATGKMLAKMDDFNGVSVNDLGISPDGKVIAASGKGKAGYWGENDLELLKMKLAPAGSTPKTDLRPYKWNAFPNMDYEGYYSGVGLTGNGKSIYYTRRNISVISPGRVFRYDRATDTSDERPGPKQFDPYSITCLTDTDSGVAAVYGNIVDKVAPDKIEPIPVVILYGLGDPKIIARGVPPIIPRNPPHRITFATDGKWLAAYSKMLAVWPVPGSHMIGGDPTLFSNVHTAAVGPNNVLATVTAPSELHPATVETWRLTLQTRTFSFFGIPVNKRVTEAKKIADYPTLLQDVSCLAFSPDGRTLAVGSFREGLVQLWNVEAK